MKTLWWLTFICVLSAISFTDETLGHDFCVNPNGSGETDLQTALTIAQSNGSDDKIRIVQGIYNGNFRHDSSQSNSLTLEGGYTVGCSSRKVNPANTILDGGNNDIVLTISNTNGGDIHIDGVTAQNGNALSLSGGALWQSEI